MVSADFFALYAALFAGKAKGRPFGTSPQEIIYFSYTMFSHVEAPFGQPSLFSM